MSAASGWVWGVACCLMCSTLGCADGTTDCIQEDSVAAQDGNVSDETWLVFKDMQARATLDALDSPAFVMPSDGDVLRTDGPPPTFSWTSALKLSAAEPLHAQHPRKDALGRAVEALAQLVIPSAHAHLPPKTGDMYLVEISLNGMLCPLGLHTSNLEMPLNADTWSTLAAHAGEMATATLVGAYLLQNRVLEGPYRAAPVRFRLE